MHVAMYVYTPYNVTQAAMVATKSVVVNCLYMHVCIQV